MSEERRIVRVAIRHPDGRVWTCPEPCRHHHVIGECRQYGWTRDEIAKADQGFTDASGAFRTRAEAYRVAAGNGQLKSKPGGYDGPELYSEDLW